MSIEAIVDGDIEFGDVQHSQPRLALRPDVDMHFAVEPLGSPAEGELPIFVDLDVMREIEQHAASDTSVELGGVLLGGQFEDSDGKPFVVVTDCLRAQHYESTKGSFKFTHETWSAITRQRDEFPPELEMVGWYHTHPDWGVFLSGMDMFICDHFFNRPLDVAYVVDPCRGDRGMFQWTRDARERTRRTAGFYVTASRFRADELRHFIEQLAQKGPSMPAYPTSSGQPVIHFTQPPTPPWQGVAVWGTLVAQFCLLAIIAWKMFEPASAPVVGAGVTSPAIQQQQREAALQVEFVDRVLGRLHDTPDGFAERLQQDFSESADLKDALKVEQQQHVALVKDMNRANDALMEDVAKLNDKLEHVKEQLDELGADNKQLRAKVAATDAATKAAKKKAAAAGSEEETERWPWTYFAGGGAIVLALACVGFAFLWRKRPEDTDLDNRPEESSSGRPDQLPPSDASRLPPE